MRTIVAAVCLACLFTGGAQAANYYVDAQGGNDKNTGTDPGQAWKSIGPVNRTTFQPGDSILFRRGASWLTDKALAPKGSGKPGVPIVISCYGQGMLPLLSGNGFEKQGVVTLTNQSYWVVSNLELIHWAPEKGERRGVEISAANAGLIRGIHLRDLVIHHIKGIRANDNFAKRTAGIAFFVRNDKELPTRYDDILVEGCTIYTVENQGIVFDNLTGLKDNSPHGPRWKDKMFTNVTVRNNVVYDISKNAMIVRLTDGGVVEHNVCFNTAQIAHGGNTIFSRNARGTVFQYNEGFMNRSPNHDGSLYDPDLGSPEMVFQYSYSHDNAHGLAWFCTEPPDNDIIVRDNLSENDRGMLLYVNYRFKSAYIYRNLFYAGDHVSPWFFRENPDRTHQFFTINNNLVVNRSRGMGYEYIVPDKQQRPGSVRDVRDNMFVGVPLKGDYTSADIDLSQFKRFHRGFLYANALDTLVGNEVRLFRPGDKKPAAQVVGRINRLPVYRWEFDREAEQCRWEFTDRKGVIDWTGLYAKILKNLTLIKVQQQEMIARGMPEAAVFDHFEELLAMENDFRREHAAKERVVFYGPIQYKKNDFWHYCFANAQESLRWRMMRDTLAMTEEELKAYFEEHKLAIWEKREFGYSRDRVRTALLDEKYVRYFEGKAVAAKVDMPKSPPVKTSL